MAQISKPVGVTGSHPRLRVAFLLADRFTLSAFANFVDVLRLAADEADKSRPILCDWTVLSETMDPIRSSSGVSVTPNSTLRRAGAFDYLVVVGGVMSDKPAFGAIEAAYLKQSAAQGVPIIGLCTGVFLMHEAGLLDGYRSCVSWFHYQDFVDRFSAVEPVSDQIFVVDRDRMTCSGGHGTAHLAAFLVERHIGQAAATKSLNILMIDAPLMGNEAQPGQQTPRQPRDPLVKRAILRMQENLDVPVTISAIARHLAVGRRTLERRFDKDLDRAPSKVYLDLRLDRALLKLRSTDVAIAEISLATGFCDGTHLARTLKAERGFTPQQYRNQRRAALLLGN